MQKLVDQGKSIIFITHKLREVMEFADRITVIRGGKVIGTTTPGETDQFKLASMMVGRQIVLNIEKNPPKTGDVVLDVKNLKVLNVRHQVAVDNVSFEVHSGEVIGYCRCPGEWPN